MKARKQTLVMILALAVLQGLPSQTQAGFFDWGGDRDRDRGRHDGPFFTPHYVGPGHRFHNLPYEYTRLILGGLEFFYAEGMFYRMEGGEYVVVNAPVGAVVTAVPSGAQAVVVNGVPYYSINGVSYMQTTAGYQVVPAPVAVVNGTATVVTPAPVASPATVAPPPADDTFTVNIPNAHGTYTAVNLRRSGGGFVGPQGEFYTEFPRVDQLKAMYGK